jgi:phospholipid-translocating ATPase
MFGIWLFEEEFVHIVSITFTALVFNELLMVAFEITTWHRIMVYSEIFTVIIYIASMTALQTEFDLNFILTWRFVWKTAVITLFSCFPLYILRFVRQTYSPPVYAKLQN